MTLQWPEGWPRTPPHKRERGRFNGGKREGGGWGTRDLTVAAAISRVQEEVRLFDGSGLRIETDMPTRNDGLPISKAAMPDDPGVVVSFRLPGGRPVVFPCDRYTHVAQNLAAVAATLDAKRAIERHGVSTLDREFEGYLYLPSGDPATDLAAQQDRLATPTLRRVVALATQQAPHEILGVAPDAPPAVIEAAWRALAKDAHPDRGGSNEAMHRITTARDALLKRPPT